ncbi:hypothetical protein ACMX2H_12160 [Arthrobacter sulfonylureivorans]|uniref:hypothetical protein n=1 Tax=Arthrobacter sulfonylureivorans TaxID=2486855 RepID=UPI0039E5989F
MTETAAPAGRPLWWGLLLVIGGWAALGFPMFWALLVMYIGFTGCLLECAAPDPASGFFGLAALLIMIAAPVLAAIALVRRSRAWWIATACLLALILVPLAYGTVIGSF